MYSYSNVLIWSISDHHMNYQDKQLKFLELRANIKLNRRNYNLGTLPSMESNENIQGIVNFKMQHLTQFGGFHGIANLVNLSKS